MDVGRRRRGVVSGSVWESRIRVDEVKGGIRSLINTSQTEEESENPQELDDQDSIFSPRSSDGVHQEDEKASVGQKPSPGGRRKTWKSDTFEVSPIQIARKTRSCFTKSLDEENFKELAMKSPFRGSPAEKMKPRKVNYTKSRKDFEVAVEDTNNVNKPNGVQKTRSEEDCEEEGDEVPWEEAQENIEVNVENKNIVIVEKKIDDSKERIVLPSVKKQPSPIPSRTKSEESQRALRPHSRLQSYVDIVMWRDVSRSAFVFGVGTFLMISSSYLQDYKISMISVLSYMGLVYLAVIFTFRSFIHRGAMGVVERGDYIVGEDEAMWAVKMILPYINEFLLNIKALFSGDPAKTMKMAVLLFVMAQCGSSITLWKMAKLGFFGVFMVPKLYSSYSSQLTAFGTPWIRRFKDSSESCAHKKAVVFGVFALLWIFSSVSARIWEAFMLYVAAFRYYQNRLR